MESVNGDSVPDVPGLSIRRLESGMSIIEVKPGSHTVEEVLQSLRTLAASTDLKISEIDLTGLSSESDRRKYHHDIALVIMPFLFRDELLRISLPKVVTHEVRGVCKGLVVDPFRQEVGTHIYVPSAESCVPIRRCIMTQEIVDKTSSSDPMSLQQMQATIEVLKDTQTRDEVPYVLGNVIMRAARHLRKLRRARREGKTGMNNFNNDENTNATTCSPCDNYDMSSDSNSDIEQPCTRKKDTCVSTPIKSNLPKLSQDQRANINASVLKCLGSNNHCYVCKRKYTYPKKVKKLDVAWYQYPRLCHFCATENYAKRHQKTDLTGKYAVVTGGRIKIGFHIVTKLLRDGAHVIATTRFPRDAASRFRAEPDFDTFKDRLKIYPLEMKSLSAVYQFIEYVNDTFPHLDILINNAAQTISRPMKFYDHLLDHETAPISTLDDATIQLLASREVLNYYGTNGTQIPSLGSCPKTSQHQSHFNVVQPVESSNSSSGQATARVKLKRSHSSSSTDETETTSGDSIKRPHILDEDDKADVDMECIDIDETLPDESPNIDSNKYLVQSAPVEVTTAECDTPTRTMSTYFPTGQLDADGQQLDLRPMNTWRMPMEQVPLPELLEVLAVNAVAPFILDQSLKPLLDKSPARRKFIVNVSAMEGQFNRGQKNHFHPHTNMAKASLNMLTRTAAVGYMESGVYMTAVDTGWVTDERPYPQAKYEEEKGFVLPLDIVDGAARVYDPVVSGLNNEKKPFYAVFLKDYKEHPW